MNLFDLSNALTPQVDGDPHAHIRVGVIVTASPLMISLDGQTVPADPLNGLSLAASDVVVALVRVNCAPLVVGTVNAGAAATGTYTPTLDQITLGTTGAVNTANYSYAGGTLHLEGDIVLGTGGSVAAAGGNHTVTIPVGFTIIRQSSLRPAGQVRYVVGGGGYTGVVAVVTNKLRFTVEAVNGTYPTLQSLSNNVPGVWAAGDAIRWEATLSVTRS